MPSKDLTELRDSDVFDSREVIERIAELEAMLPDSAADVMPGAPQDIEGARAELATLQAFAAEAEGYAADWHYGEGFIRDSYFVEYAQKLADDIGAVDKDCGWPNSHIDWEAAAEALKQDYSAIELDGVTFWTR